MPRVHADRAAVRRNFVDVEYRQAMRCEQALHRQERVIAEMFVIDGVELVALDEPHQMLDLNHGDAALGQAAIAFRGQNR